MYPTKYIMLLSHNMNDYREIDTETVQNIIAL